MKLKLIMKTSCAHAGTRISTAVCLGAAASATILIAQPSRAEVPEPRKPASQLSPLEVHGTRPTAEPFTSFPYPGTGGASRVEAAEIARGTGRTLESVLQSVPGVRAQSRAGDDVFLSVRGSGLQSVVFTKARGTDVLIDGIPINSADGNFDYSLISPLDALSTEVFRGNAAFGLGSMTLGGAINLTTPTGRDLDGGRLRFDLGSFGFMRASAAYGASNENSDVAFRYTWQEQDGFRDFHSGDSQKLSGSIGYRINDALENRIYLNASTVRQEVSLPITQAQVENNPRQAGALNAATRPYFDVDTVRIADKLTYTTPDLTAEAAIYYLYRDVDFRRPSMPPTGYRLGPGWLDAHTDDFGGQVRLTKKSEIANHANEFTAGLLVAYMTGHEDLYPNLATVKGPRFASGDLTAWNTTLWFENEFSLTDRIDVVAGLKASYAYREYKDQQRIGAGNVSGDREYTGLSPELAVKWQATDTTRFFASLSRSFEPPAFGDLIGIPVVPPPPQRVSFRDLDAQEATTLEIGTSGTVLDDRLTWSVNLYRSWLDDEIVRFDDGTQTGNQVGRNADKTIHDGLELTLNARLWESHDTGADGPTDRLSLRTSFTWNDYRFNGDPLFGNNKLAGVPEQTIFGELLYEHRSGVYLGVNITGIPTGYAADNANTFEVNSYTLLGARAGWNGERLCVFVEGSNLTDEAYVAGLQNGTNLGGNDSAIFFSGPGRTVYAGVEWRW